MWFLQRHENNRDKLGHFHVGCPREESNLDYKIRNLVSYPLNDEGNRDKLTQKRLQYYKVSIDHKKGD